MKILVYSFGDFFAPHLETQGDLIQQHLDRGDEVTMFVCSSVLPVCRVNLDHRLLHCSSCMARRAGISRLIDPRVAQRPILNLQRRDRETVQRFRFEGTTIHDLKALSFGSFDIGMAVASAVIDEVRDPLPEVASLRRRIQDWLSTSLAVYLSVGRTLDEERPDGVYVFNGRRAYYRGVVRACQERGIDFWVHDGHRNLARHTLVKNRLHHDIAGWCHDVEDLWSVADPETREQIGAQFFEEQVSGKDLWRFAAEQRKGALPEDWDPNRRNIAVFPGSEFEVASISKEFNYPFYASQNEGLKRILRSLEESNAPVHLNIRLHPHLKHDDNPTLRDLLALRSSKATLIPPQSPVSTYELMFNCEKVLTFGSTVGIEAVYWGIPSILAGRSFYQTLGGTFNPKSHEELMELLVARLEPRPKSAALKYGYHELRRGAPHVYYERESLWSGRFKGVRVDDHIPWYWRVVLRITHSRLYRALDSMWRVHRAYLRWKLGFPGVGRGAQEAGGMVDQPASCSSPAPVEETVAV